MATKKRATPKKRRPSRAVGTRKGKFTTKEKDYIIKWARQKSYAQIATELNRPVQLVEKYGVELLAGRVLSSDDLEMNEKIRGDLYADPQWKFFQKQFTDEELLLFEQSYIELMTQFNSNVHATEKTQLFTVINIGIRIHRHNIQVHRMEQDLLRTQMLCDHAQEQWDTTDPKKCTEKHREQLITLQNQMVAMQKGITDKNKELTNLIDRQTETLSKLRGTREQRVKQIEESKENYIKMLKSLMDEDMAQRVGTTMLIQAKAVEKERKRLASYHKFGDGEVDLPILNSDTIMEVEEEE